MNNALGVLGIAKKAGLLVIGDESVNAAAKQRKAKLILSAADASDASKRHAQYYAESGGVWAQLEFTKSELAEVIGRGAPGMIAVTDPGLAHSFISKLAETGMKDCEHIIEKLRKDAENQTQRRREAAAHKRNNRTGKGRTGK